MATSIGKTKPHIRAAPGRVGAPETGDVFATKKVMGWGATWTEGHSYRSTWSTTIESAFATCAKWWTEGSRASVPKEA